MNNLSEVNDAILKDWLDFREEDLYHMKQEDKKYMINFDDYSKRILNNITKESYNYISKRLELCTMILLIIVLI